MSLHRMYIIDLASIYKSNYYKFKSYVICFRIIYYNTHLLQLNMKYHIFNQKNQFLNSFLIETFIELNILTAQL